ncbi:MAG: hypothetical protein PHE29_03465 [Tissierellia bacterium]|nr:hypothetical protein [Tissierellia bacterium]MDD4780882.1 hypothetical protein [Tissierellia bacterium]
MNLEFNIDSKKFLNYYKKQYLNNPLKRDSLSSLLKGLIYNKSEMCKSVDLEPVAVVDKGKIVMICLLAYAHRMPDYIQIGFFESEELNMEAFELILNRAKNLAKEKNAHKISASLNIHVNYGLGFLASDYDSMQSFGMAHNPKFYHLYFESNGFKSIDMVSYKKNMSCVNELLNFKIINKLNKLYKVREANFKELKKEINIYTNVNNRAFKDHLFYYPRIVDEDLELFKDLRFLLKPENLLFVEKNGEVVGFMLWYPDFNQIIKPNEMVGLKTVIKNNFFSNKITTFKIVEMGVIPEEQNKGAILALFNYCFQLVKGKYDNVESGWILSHNDKSKNFGIKWADGESKRYKAYIKDLNNEI